MSDNPSIPLIIYHGNCLDGYGAAYAAWRHFGEEGSELYPASHGDKLPENLAGRTVYFVDFSVKRAPMIEICKQADEVIVIDHHISAYEDLEGLENEINNLTLKFDMEHSGAVLTWKYFHPQTEVPHILYLVEDRDIWRWSYPISKEVTAVMMTYPFEMKLWQRWCEEPDAVDNLHKEGETIERYRRQMIERYKKKSFMIEISGYKVPAVNAPSEIVSELVGELSEGHPFAASFSEKEKSRSWSLRSHGKHGEDVAHIASLFGGGGHRNAAGFSTPLEMSTRLLIPDAS